MLRMRFIGDLLLIILVSHAFTSRYFSYGLLSVEQNWREGSQSRLSDYFSVIQTPPLNEYCFILKTIFLIALRSDSYIPTFTKPP
ncbi:TPA: hypothetical protein ACY3ID_000715 [Citrobacter amalonaticus]|uniref:Secreted protein n=2 Tax=Citrobacter amalonaticus TaxID=35703 RepID=A0AAW9LXC8_CITAM|nr:MULTISPECIES: hypothetical protein [Citrobacter]MDU1755256.1 hypothetical protein [Citrobacter sp.]MDV2136092.1 hypothetical protein [Citrobacter amalonaticus]MEB0583598.1 hypothetical protein [Citrobacter amalonaticus]QIO37521.1 hypothetical protein HAP28_12600 [Citrobacter sp. Y3]SAZ54344.1 protein of unknown function [Citrobacter amalonaticus]